MTKNYSKTSLLLVERVGYFVWMDLMMFLSVKPINNETISKYRTAAVSDFDSFLCRKKEKTDFFPLMDYLYDKQI